LLLCIACINYLFVLNLYVKFLVFLVILFIFYFELREDVDYDTRL
jgi:hypothetical protein